MNTPDAIVKTVVVRCGVSTAFRVWTERIDTWWPKGHSRSGDPQTTILLERHVGGRLYERTPAGVEHDWGAVIAWDPPRHFAYHWYLGSGAAQPTLVDVYFALHDDGTRVEVIHRGPEFIGELWPRRNSMYSGAWDNVMGAYAAHIVASAIEEDLP